MLQDILGQCRREPAECVIRFGESGEEISDLYPLLSQVVVDRTRTEASVAQLAFESRRDERGQWSVQDDPRIVPWVRVVIEAAFGGYSEEVFRGYVRELRADYPQDRSGVSVNLECQDDSLALDREHVRRVWGADAPTSDTAILTEIVAQRHHLAPHPDNGPGQQGLVVNQDETDVRFLRKRAQANAYELLFLAGEVYFGPMRLDAAAQETILVYAGTDTHCQRLSISADGHQPDRVAFDLPATEGDDVLTRVVEPSLERMGSTPADSTASGLGDFTWRMSRHGGGNEEELAARAQHLANEAAMKVRAEGELDGSRYGHVLRVGEPVGVDGVGQKLGGIYYVDRVRHVFDTRGYRQSFTLLRNAFGDNLPVGGLSVLAGL